MLEGVRRRRLALRGEMTPSVARMAIARAGALRMPLRWFMLGQNWRYERMTRGRRREHYQWNVELIGEPGVGAEAELIAAIFTLVDRLGLEREDVRTRLSSRALLEELLCTAKIFVPFSQVGKHGAANHRRQHHVFERRQFRQQMIELKDHTDLFVSEFVAFERRQRIDTMFVEMDFPGIGSIECREQMQQSALTGTALAHD